MKKYAIETIGYGKRRRYAVVEVTATGTNPTDGRAYWTEEAARDAASAMGVAVSKVGDFYEII